MVVTSIVGLLYEYFIAFMVLIMKSMMLILILFVVVIIDILLGGKTNVLSLTAEVAPSIGLTIYKMPNISSYELHVRSMEGLEWSLTTYSFSEPHEWEHVTVTWHDMWGLRVFINGEPSSYTNLPEFIATGDLVPATHVKIGGVLGENGSVSSLGTNLQMSDLRIWERFVSEEEVMANYMTSCKY